MYYSPEWWRQSNIPVPLPERVSTTDAPMRVCWDYPADPDDLAFPSVPPCWICQTRRHVEPVPDNLTEYYCRACEVAWVPGEAADS